ncbi:MAG: ABC transporter permease [Candidatus Aminicenantes bacterium]
MNTNERQPPRIAGWFIRQMFPDKGECSVLGDMIENYHSIAGHKGVFWARLWFWGQFLKAFPHFLIDESKWRIQMLKSYLMVALRNLRKNSTYSFLNIMGLAVGMTAFILISLYVRHELSFDKYHDNANRIYRVIREGRAFTPAALGPELKEKIPEVELVTRMIHRSNTLISYEQKHFLEEDFYWAGPETFRIFSIPFISGDPGTALDDPSAIVLSSRAARKYFGNENPMGKTLTVSERYEFRVSGVFNDMPDNSHFVMDAVAPYKIYFRVTNSNINGWRSNFSYTYFLLRDGADPQTMENKIYPLIETPLYKAAGINDPQPKYFFIQPMTEIHLHSQLMQEIGPNNNIKYIILFSSVAFLILFIACINYMNLATARSLRRGKEVGMRKVVGAQKSQLIAQFLGESVIMALVAMFFSVVMVIGVLPAFNGLVERRLSLNPFHDPQLFVGLVGITLIVGMFAGSYPAMRMSGFRPISVLGSSFTRSAKGSSLRNVLVLVQFSITIFLIICTLAVRDQLRFIKTVDVGYTKEQIVTLPVRGRSARQNIQSIKTELLKYPDIMAASTSTRLPNNIDTFTSRNWIDRNLEEPIAIFYNTADYDFVDLYGMQIVQGRNFSRDFPSDEKGAFLVNETAVTVAEWESPIGRTFAHWNGAKGEIVGVLKDFHLRSLHSPIEPMYIFLNPSSFSNISVKISSTNIPTTIEYMEGVMKRFAPSTPFSYSFFDEVFERAYFTEQRMGSVFGAFAILAIFIACLGLFGLSVFAAEQRTKEIGIRKVLGASVAKIFLLLSKEFVRWVLFANLIAWPIAYFTMNKWLENFAYRIQIGVVAFLISGGTALLIAYLTVSYQSIKAARANPIISLRYE